MSNKPMPWIRQYTARLHDVRLASLNERQQLRFFQLYLLAGQLNADGGFTQDGKELTIPQIAYLLRVSDPKQLEKDLAALKKSKLLRVNGHGPFISEFKDEQINWLEKQREDRERQQRKREADASHASNEGVTRDASVTHAPRTRPELRPDQIRIDKNPTNHPSPPSTSEPAKLVGVVAGLKNIFEDPEMAVLLKTKKARTETEKIAGVLHLAGLGEKKLIPLIHKVAARSFKGDKLHYVIAALASVYDDDSVRNKSIVAAHRIESDTVPAHYLSPAKWTNVPQNILDLCGIKPTKAENSRRASAFDEYLKHDSGNRPGCVHVDIIGYRKDGTPIADKKKGRCKKPVVKGTQFCKDHQEAE